MDVHEQIIDILWIIFINIKYLLMVNFLWYFYDNNIFRPSVHPLLFSVLRFFFRTTALFVEQVVYLF